MSRPKVQNDIETRQSYKSLEAGIDVCRAARDRQVEDRIHCRVWRADLQLGQ